MFQFKFEDRRQEKPYLYRLNLECLGRAVEVGVSLKDIQLLFETGKLIVTKPKEIGTHVRSLKEKLGKNEVSSTSNKSKKVARKEEAVAANA